MTKFSPQKILSYVVLSTMILGAFWMFGKIWSSQLYAEYAALWDYRRLHPDFLPNANTEKIISVGHENTYADITWLKLIQFIGDNIWNGKYVTFTHDILTHITTLNPYFARWYEIDLLMAPLIYPDSGKETVKKHEALIRGILAHGEVGIEKLCNKDMLEEINKTPLDGKFQEKYHLRNPCSNGMIPYYMGYHYNNVFRDGKNAEKYYKIASMQDDTPKASQFLAALAKSSDGNYKDSALSFFLIARDGYDTEPFSCQKLADELTKNLIQNREFSINWIQEIVTKEQWLHDNKDPQKPESYANNNCFDSIERGIKQLYIWYVADIASKYPEIKTSRELVEKGIIPFTPIIQSQKHFYLIRMDDGSWKYKTDNAFQ